ncbi:MAG TPA: S41 family peptidase [Thermoanaerobaculia bacterium]|nr:S41 family peptidase [Thermoanaerobaculia bacterium]
MILKRLFPATLLGLLLLGASEPPRPLTDRELDHLAAYARLLSLVRFFHPSDAVAAADWNRVAVAGVQAIAGAENPESLAQSLESFFRPLAPTLRVVPKGSQWEMPPELRRPDGDVRIVAWRHYGGDFGAERKVFSSERIDDRNPSFGTLAVAMPAKPYQGNHVSLTAWVRSDVEGDGRVQLGLRVIRPGDKPGFFDNMADRPIFDTPWRKVKIEGEVAVDAERIVILLVLNGPGKVWLDEVELDAPPIIEPLRNSGARGPQRGRPKTGLPDDTSNLGFDKGETGQQPPGWTFPYESIRAGYHLAVERGEGCRKGGCARIESDPIAAPRFARPEEVVEVDLGAGVAAFVPVSLYADDQGTLPRTAPAPPPAVDVNGDTREARLAAVALAWGILQHLHPELRPDDPAWSTALRSVLAAAAQDQESFLRAARLLLVPLKDARAGFLRKGGVTPQALPLAWEHIEGQLTITGAAGNTGGVPGDVVVALDGRPIEEVLKEEEALVSSATPEARRWRALENLIFGPPGSRVTLRLKRGAEVELFRETPYDRLPPGTPLEPVAEPRPGIVYVDLARVEEKDFEALLKRLAAARGVVFDLRQGSNVSNIVLSHLTDRATASSNWQVPVVMAPDHRNVEWMTTFWTVEPRKPRLRRTAFLVDGRSDGFSETLLDTIEEYRLGEIVGDRSGGSNGSVNRSDLPGGYRLVWTGQRVLKHDGSPLHGIGVSPTVPAVRTIQGVAAGRDEIAEKAAEILLRN